MQITMMRLTMESPTKFQLFCWFSSNDGNECGHIWKRLGNGLEARVLDSELQEY
jgi:hypothetical protein